MSRPITVVQFWAGCPKSPNSKWQRFLALVQRCRDEGWRNCLVWSRMPEDPAFAEPFKEAGCEIILQPRSRRNFDPASIWRVYSFLRERRCDIFHCHNDHTSPLIGATLAHVPVRIWSKLSMSSFYELQRPPKGIQCLYLSNRISSWCSHLVLALTEPIRQEFMKQGGSRDKTVVVPGPVDVERFATASSDGVREELGLASSAFVITAVGHAVPVKGWDILLRAFAKVAAGKDDLHLLLVGSTDAPNERQFAEGLRCLAASTECAGRVHFGGHRSNAAEILKASDLFVFPSRSDGQGLALVEAMASGLPCLAAATGGIPDVITDGLNGLLFERENIADLVQKLSRLLKDDQLRLRLAAAARDAANRYTMDTYVQAVFECYRSLLEQRGRFLG
jgi:glycosyltransferase involved in cell wall biosynthesis